MVGTLIQTICSDLRKFQQINVDGSDQESQLVSQLGYQSNQGQELLLPSFSFSLSLFFFVLAWVVFGYQCIGEKLQNMGGITTQRGEQSNQSIRFHLGVETRVKMDLRLGQRGIGQLWKKTAKGGTAANFARLLWTGQATFGAENQRGAASRSQLPIETSLV